MFNWDDLRFFMAVARSRSLSSAAGKLGVTHTTVARRIQALEAALKTRLFEHAATGYMPSAPGKQLMAFTESMESAFASIEEAVAVQDILLTGTVRLGLPEGLGLGFLMARLGRFYELHSGIDLEIVTGAHFLNITKRDMDIAITPSRPRVGTLIARKLTDYTLQLYGSESYLQRHEPPSRVQDLHQHSLIGYIEDLIYAPQLPYLDQMLPQARVRLRSSSINGQFAAIEAGLGLGILPSYMTSGSNLKPVLCDDINGKLSVWISTHRDLRHIRRISEVWEWLVALVGEEKETLVASKAESADQASLNV
jgi:DNA-binding transcriptional LysR family regulator